MKHPPCDRVVVAFELNRRPHPKGRPRFNSKTKRTYTDAQTVAYENEVRDACVAAMKGRAPWPGPVELACLFEQRDAKVADTDNLIKACSDAINGAAFVDDKQVVSIRAARVKSDVDRVSVAVVAVGA